MRAMTSHCGAISPVSVPGSSSVRCLHTHLTVVHCTQSSADLDSVIADRAWSSMTPPPLSTLQAPAPVQPLSLCPAPARR